MTKPVLAQILRYLERGLGVTAEDDLAQVRELVAEARKPAWWEHHDYADALTPGYVIHLAQEEDSHALHTWEPRLVPGLLQTRRYTEALMDTHRPPLSAQERTARLALRSERQRRLVQEEQYPSRLWAILDETAIRRLVGGREVMLEQLRHLINCSRQPHIDLQITPFHAGATSATEPFVIFYPQNPLDPEAVSMELTPGSIWYEDATNVASYQDLFVSVMKASLNVNATRSLLRKCVADLGG